MCKIVVVVVLEEYFIRKLVFMKELVVSYIVVKERNGIVLYLFFVFFVFDFDDVKNYEI